MTLPSDSLPANVLAALQQGNSIEAIKLLREATGLGLKDAKDVIDHHRRGSSRPRATVASMLTLPFVVSSALRQGNKIEAIRLLREKAGLGLKEAKDAVESFESESKGEEGQRSPGEVPKSGGGFWLLAVLAAVVLLGYYLFARSS
jgi:ribosomal protein L7/L12